MPPRRIRRVGPGFGPGAAVEFAISTVPVVTSVTPNFDGITGGASVTITGLNFRNNPDGSAPTVKFGDQLATSVVVVDPATITSVVPAASPATNKVVSVSVTINGEVGTLLNAFSYVAAAVVEVEPPSGPVGGGTAIIIHGNNFAAGSSILINGVAATGVTFIDAEHYAATTPASTAHGFVDIVIGAPNNVVAKNAFQYTRLVRGDDIRLMSNPTIRDILNNTPNTCRYDIDGQSAKPLIGERVEILDGAALIFAGNVQMVDQDYEGLTDQLVWRVNAVDFTWLLNKERPVGTYVNVSATGVVKDLINRYAPRFTTNFVQEGLAPITISFDGTQDLSTDLSDIAQMIGGGHWYVDYEQHTHFFRVVPPGVTIPTVPESVLRQGPGTAMTVSEGGGIPISFSYTPRYSIFFSTFVYSNGTESIPSPLSNPVRLRGRNITSFTGVPIGSAVGAFTCVARRIYELQITNFAVNLKVPRKYVQINDNTTTNFTTYLDVRGASVASIGAIPATARLPRRPYVPPPAGINQQVTAVDGSGDLETIGGGKVSTTPGSIKFRLTALYADGTESYSTRPTSASVNSWNGKNPIDIGNIPVFPTINGVGVVAVLVYKSYVDGPDAFRLFSLIPGNPGGSYHVSVLVGPANMPVEQGDTTAPVQGHVDGPFLENATPPDDIDDLNLSLLREPPFRSSEDGSQVRNRIHVYGAGSIATSTHPVGSLTVAVADVSVYDVSGGAVGIGGQRVQYFGVSGIEFGPGELFLSEPTWFAIKEGDRVELVITVDDVEAQKTLGRRELDDQGNETDGVHEYVIRDEGLRTFAQLYRRAFSELELFGRPTITIDYATRDPKTKAGRVVHVDLTDPPCSGDFLIQEVLIDQIYISSEVGPRYHARATSVRFDLEDLLLQIAAVAIGGGAESGLGGVIRSSVQQAVTTVGSAVILQVQTRLTATQLGALAGSPVVLVPAPGAGLSLIPVQLVVDTWRLDSTPWSSGPNYELQYEGQGQFDNILNTTIGSFLSAGAFLPPANAHGQQLAANQSFGYVAGSADVINKGLQIRFNSDTNPGGAAHADVSLLYYVKSASST